MDADPDIQLVKLCQSGDISAFEELVCKYKDRIYRLAYKMLGGADDVDDVAQEIFLKAYRGIKKFRLQSSFSTWLVQIAVNYCISHLKSQRKFKSLSLNVISKRSSAETQAIAERNEKREKVYQAINSLPLKRRAVIVLHYFEDYTCEEIADVLNCSVGTVKSRLFYARKDLKDRLEPYLKGDTEIGGEDYEMFKM